MNRVISTLTIVSKCCCSIFVSKCCLRLVPVVPIGAPPLPIYRPARLYTPEKEKTLTTYKPSNQLRNPLLVPENHIRHPPAIDFMCPPNPTGTISASEKSEKNQKKKRPHRPPVRSGRTYKINITSSWLLANFQLGFVKPGEIKNLFLKISNAHLLRSFSHDKEIQ